MISAKSFFQLLLLNHGSHRPIHDQDALAGELLEVLDVGGVLKSLSLTYQHIMIC